MIILDSKDRRPLYEQIEEKLSILIMKGVLAEDEQLPSVRALASNLSINPNTVQRAYNELESKGLIYSAVGRGNFVSSAKVARELERQEVLKQLGALVVRAKNADMPKEELTEFVNSSYGEAQESDRS
ncbi:MAG: GntR family transcriptional regulator [Firmicutes bacterium]|nr:GntR family transcriptional regulator [Bacillota bacterium]